MWSGRFGYQELARLLNRLKGEPYQQRIQYHCSAAPVALGPSTTTARAPPWPRRPSSREVRCGAARRLRSATPAWEASALAARPPSGDLRVARLRICSLANLCARERALTLLHFRLASLRSLRVEEAAGVQVQDALAPVLQVRPSRRSPSRRAATEPSITVTGPSPRPPARPPVAGRQPPTSPCTVPRTSVPRAG